MKKQLLEVQNLHVSVGDREILHGVNLSRRAATRRMY